MHILLGQAATFTFPWGTFMPIFGGLFAMAVSAKLIMLAIDVQNPTPRSTRRRRRQRRW